MQEIVRATQTGELPMDISCIIASKEGVGGIDKAHSLGVPESDIVVVNPVDFIGDDKRVDQYGFGQGLLRELRRRGTAVVSQNGWMPLTPENIIDEYSDAIFNQHPGPIPEFGGKGMYGRRVHAAVLLFIRLTKGDMWTEVIGQRVDKEYDKGVVLKSQRIDILPEDTVDDLQQRALPQEHRTQIELLKDVAFGRVQKVHRETIILPGQEILVAQAKRAAQLLYPHG